MGGAKRRGRTARPSSRRCSRWLTRIDLDPVHRTRAALDARWSNLDPMWGRLALLGVVASVLGTLYFVGFLDLIQDPERVRSTLLELGVWAPILYVLAFALLEPFFVPGIAFIIPGAVVWGFPALLALSWLGSIGAGIVGFSFARYLGRDYVERHLPERLRRYDQDLAERSLRTVILVRLTLFIAPPAHWMLGVSQVRFVPFVLGTAIGFLPGMAALCYVVVFIGETLGAWLGSQPAEIWIALGIGVILMVAGRRWWSRRNARKRREAAPHRSGP
jgi:uncharacterized membrane protein YdjX (TVP38/TMEM64 family)